MTSEVEERPRLVTGGYRRHRSQWANILPLYFKSLSDQVRSTENKVDRPSDPCEQFLAPQGKQSLEWNSTSKAKRANVQSVIPAIKYQNEESSGDCDCHQKDSATLLCQQLAAQTEECRELKRNWNALKQLMLNSSVTR